MIVAVRPFTLINEQRLADEEAFSSINPDSVSEAARIGTASTGDMDEPLRATRESCMCRRVD